MSGKEVRMRHARRLAEITRDAESENKIGPRQSVDRPRHARCCSLLSSYDTTMYSMMLEQCRSLAVSLRAAAPRIVQACKWWCNEKRSDERALLNASIAEIEMCVGHGFSGECCCAYIGLLNPGAQSISYVAASQHSQMGGRSLQVDQGMASKCISENKTIVVENSEEARRLGVRVFGDSEQTFPAVCTPLRVRVGRPIGVLSVDGLRADTSVQRLTQKSMGPSVDFCDRLAPFLAKDDEACKRVRFWRAQSGDRPGVSGHYNKLVVARAICGHIYNIAKAKCGYNYCIRWEDGLSEENIPFRTLKELLRLTPQILGIGVLCDASVLGFVDYSGKVIGEHLIRSSLCSLSNFQHVPYP